MPSEERVRHEGDAGEAAATGAGAGPGAVGDAATVKSGLEALVARTGADELMLTTMAHAPADRIRSYELVAGAIFNGR